MTAIPPSLLARGNNYPRRSPKLINEPPRQEARFDGEANGPFPLVSALAKAATPAPAEERFPRDALNRARASDMDGLAINRLLVTPTYERLAYQFQSIVDPNFDASRAGDCRTFATWFGIGAHPSAAAGAAMRVSSDLARRAPDSIPALVAALKDLHLQEAVDPRFDAVSLVRATRLVKSAPGEGHEEKIQSVLRTMEDLFAEGNQAIFADIGEAGARYLKFREALPHPEPSFVLANFQVERSTPEGAKAIFDHAIVSLNALSEPWDLEGLTPAGRGPDAVVAGMALYEAARKASTLTLRNQLVEMANTLFSIREQRDLVDPVMNTPVRPGEASRMDLMRLLTPTLQVDAGGTPWSFAEFADTNLLPTGEHPWMPRATQYNWADLKTRMVGIQDFYRQIHLADQVGKVWNFPSQDSSTQLWGHQDISLR